MFVFIMSGNSGLKAQKIEGLSHLLDNWQFGYKYLQSTFSNGPNVEVLQSG